ncbi:MAG: NBR1-Ig-like domain-containing protein [Caldilineaceae bacterium]
MADVTIPDGTSVRAGEDFTKIWRVRNESDFAWQGYRLRKHRRRRLDQRQLRPTRGSTIPDTAAGATADIELVITAPTQPGSYTGYWQIVDADGTPVTGGQLWTIISVLAQ